MLKDTQQRIAQILLCARLVSPMVFMESPARSAQLTTTPVLMKSFSHWYTRVLLLEDSINNGDFLFSHVLSHWCLIRWKFLASIHRSSLNAAM